MPLHTMDLDKLGEYDNSCPVCRGNGTIDLNDSYLFDHLADAFDVEVEMEESEDLLQPGDLVRTNVLYEQRLYDKWVRIVRRGTESDPDDDQHWRVIDEWGNEHTLMSHEIELPANILSRAFPGDTFELYGSEFRVEPSQFWSLAKLLGKDPDTKFLDTLKCGDRVMLKPDFMGGKFHRQHDLIVRHVSRAARVVGIEYDYHEATGRPVMGPWKNCKYTRRQGIVWVGEDDLQHNTHWMRKYLGLEHMDGDDESLICAACSGEGYSEVMWDTVWYADSDYPLVGDSTIVAARVMLETGMLLLHDDHMGTHWIALTGCGQDMTWYIAWAFLVATGRIPSWFLADMSHNGACHIWRQEVKDRIIREWFKHGPSNNEWRRENWLSEASPELIAELTEETDD